MKKFSSIVRVVIAALAVVILASACAATPNVTTTRALTPAEIAVADEAARAFEATPTYLARVGGRVEQVESMRFEVFTAIESSFIDTGSRTAPIMIGEQSGASSRVQIDMASLMGPMLALSGISQSSLTMTMITDQNALYINAPILSELANLEGLGTEPEFAWVRELAAGGGRVDVDVLGGSDVLSEMGMNGGAGATEMLALLESVGDVLDGGTGEVRGVPVQIAHAQVSVADILAHSGQNLDDMGLSGSQADVLRDVSANVAVHIDEDGMARRLEYTLDFGSLISQDANAPAFDLSMWQRVDFYDYGTEIAVPTVWTDVTNDLEDLLNEIG